ncbi:MAG: hypothetical protein HY901_29915 [Deltaproteobacteria bacterium]|nr:hypothetical protein [Deltaproteobacteria bacterium]
MAWFFAWPRYSWRCPPKAQPWLANRVFDIAALVRRFELAFTSAAEDGLCELGEVDPELAEWDEAAAEILIYTVWGTSRRVPPDKGFARKLEQNYHRLIDARAHVLKAFGREVGGVVAEREQGLETNPAALRPPSPTSTSFARFTGEFAAVGALPMRSPVSADEVLKRTAAEQKSLPETRSLAALLATLPSDWVMAVAEQLNLIGEDEFELTVGSRASAQRSIVLERLLDREFVAKVYDGLGPEEREILATLIQNEGRMTYKRVTSIWTLDETDGFYWNTRPASGPLALVRRKALAFVGTRNSVAMMVMPVELEEPLRELLGVQAEEAENESEEEEC